MSTYKELLAQRDALDERITVEFNRLRLDAITTVQGLRDAYDLTPSDIFPPAARAAQRQPAKVAPKYRNPETGATWTGRGKPPVWIRNKDRTRFEIKEATTHQVACQLP